MFCIACGANNVEAARFCSQCGAALNGQSLQLNYAATTSSNDAPGAKQEVGQVRPWVRFWARMFDIYLWSILAGFCIGAMGDLVPDTLTKMPDMSFGLLILAVWIFVEALFISAFGWTPGKLLFKTTVGTSAGGMLTYVAALERSTAVWWSGLAMGMPLISLATLIHSKNTLKKEGITKWDKSGDFVVTHKQVSGGRILFAIVFFGITVPALLILRETLNKSATIGRPNERRPP